LRTAAPTRGHPPNPGGVPAIVRRSVRPDVDSRTVARHARLWGGGDGITYWIVPRLRCEFAWLEADKRVSADADELARRRRSKPRRADGRLAAVQ
jgi:hypothetical protein